MRQNPSFLKRYWPLGIPIIAGFVTGAYFLFFKKTTLEGGEGGGGGEPGGGKIPLPIFGTGGKSPTGGPRQITIQPIPGKPAPPVQLPSVAKSRKPIIGNPYSLPTNTPVNYYPNGIGTYQSSTPSPVLSWALRCKDIYEDKDGWWWLGFEGIYMANVMTKTTTFPPIIIPVPTPFPISGWIRSDLVTGAFA